MEKNKNCECKPLPFTGYYCEHYKWIRSELTTKKLGIYKQKEKINNETKRT